MKSKLSCLFMGLYLLLPAGCGDSDTDSTTQTPGSDTEETATPDQPTVEP